MQDRVSMPQAGEIKSPARNPAVHHFREIILWPLQIVTSATGNAARDCGSLFEGEAAGTPWRRFYAFGGPDVELQERQYREFISFLPHAQRFLYGEHLHRGRRWNPAIFP